MLTRRAADTGAAGVLRRRAVLQPAVAGGDRGTLPSVAAATELPLMIYDVPGPHRPPHRARRARPSRARREQRRRAEGRDRRSACDGSTPRRRARARGVQRRRLA